MTTISRQCQLRLGPEIRWEPQAVSIDLQTTPYALVAATWRDGGEKLEVEVLLQAATLNALEGYVAAMRRLLTLAEAYALAMEGLPVYVYTKTCDAVAETSELGATWRRKRVHGGVLEMPDASSSAQGHFAVTATLRLQVESHWQRAAVASAVEGSSTVAPHTTYAGGLFATDEAVTARRRGWNDLTGLTARYHWQVGGADCTFIDVDTDWKAWWDFSDKKFHMEDDDANVVSSSDQSALSGLADVVFVWEPGARMQIYVNGHQAGAGTDCVLVKQGSQVYTLFEPTGTQGLAQAQVWPTALTQAQIEALYEWGVPEGELCIVRPPADEKNTNAVYSILNVPGDGPARLRLLLGDDGAQDYAKVLVGLRQLRLPATTMWECESATLGAATATDANAAASGGSQARFTPADTSYATRVTVALGADPTHVADLTGEHRLLLAGYDSAAAVQLNLVRWRLVIAGVAGDWSDDLAFAAVASRSLLDGGTLSLPPGAWPEETQGINSSIYSGNYITLEIQARNTAGIGGGTLDLDAVYLMPLEQSGIALGTLDVSAVQMALDFANDPQSTTLISDEPQQEWAGWVDWDGGALSLLPEQTQEGAGLLRVYAFRDTTESALPNDEIDARLFVRPTWI